MFFVLSKILNYLTMPLVIVCICFLLYIIIRRPDWRKMLLWTGFGLLFFFSNDFIANEIMMAWEPDATPYIDIKKKYEYGIVLTGVTSSELTPRDRVYFHKGAERVTHTVQLYKLGIIKNIIVSGGNGRLVDTGVREANDFMDAMIMMGVPVENILVEDLSRNTFESAVEVKKLLDRRLIKPSECVLITSAFHMRRSLACFRKADMDMDTFTTDFYTHRRTFTPDALFVPRTEAMLIWQRLIKEWVGFVAYKIVGYV